MRREIFPAAVLILAALLLAGVAESADRVTPIDLLEHMPGQKADIKRTGENEFEWSLPTGRGQFLKFDLGKAGIDPKDYDEFRFDLKPIGSQVGLYLALYHHPEKDQKSGWYLKFRAPAGAWSSGRFDLHLDDDGVYVGPPGPDERPKMMGIRLYRRVLGFIGEPKWRKARIRNVRLVRHIVSADFKLMDTRIVENGAEIAYLYSLRVKNRTDRSQKAKIDLDSRKALKHFKVTGPTDVELKAGEEKVLPIKISMSRKEAEKLEPLYSEPLLPKVYIDGIEDSDVVPMRGYRPFYMWASVPILDRKKWEPARFREVLAERKKVLPQISGWEGNISSRADKAMKHKWPVPTSPYPLHDQICRCAKCRQWLRPIDPTDVTKLKCYGCNKVWDNDPTMTAAYLMRYHSRRARDVRSLALAYLVTGKIDYAEKATEMLLDYAEAYPKMPIKGTRSTSGMGKLGANSLHHSYVVPYFAEGYGFLRDAPCLDDGKRARIVHFLKETAIGSVRHSVEYSNQQAEHFRAYASVGLATGFWPLAAEAIYGDFGWHEVVEYGYSEDGIAHEGGGYHRAVFFAMNDLAQYAWCEGVRNILTPRFKRVYNGSIISGLVSPGSSSYELAYIVYKDPLFLAYLKDRRGMAMAVFGLPNLPKPEEVVVKSDHLAGAGHIYLRKGTALDSIEIHLNYIRFFDRTERDKFTTFFKHNGRQVDSTVARITYGSPRAGWMYQTAAHNTIVIDGRSHEGTDIDGELVAYDPSPDAPIGVVCTNPRAPLYKGVEQLRCIALIGNAYVVFDRVESKERHSIDRYQWGKGTAEMKFDAKAVDAPPKHIPPAGKFSKIRGGRCGRNLRIDFSNFLKMNLVSDRDMEAYKAMTVAGYQAYPAEVTFARVGDAKEATFLATFTYGKDSEPPKARIVKSSAAEMVFKIEEGGKTHTVTINPAAKKVTVATR